MHARARELISHGDALFSRRQPLLSLWQQSAENFHVMRADFTVQRCFSEEFAAHLMTGRPALAHRDLANALPALLRPHDRQWLWARTYEEAINDDREARGFLDWMSRRIYRALYEQRSGFVRSAKEVDGDYSAFGQGVFTIEPNELLDGLTIRAHHLRDVAWTEGHDLKINAVHHKRQLSVRDLNKLYRGKIADCVRTALLKEPDREIECRRIVVPAEEYEELKIRNRRRFPFALLTIDLENETILEEIPSRTLRYVIPRWATVSGSQYAYAPSVVYGMSDARMLQQITLTMLEASQKATDPPMIAVSEAIGGGGVNSGAGMITWTDPDYDERTGEVLRPMTLRFDGIQYGAAREQRIEAMLDATFFLNQLRMPQVTKDMTAYEASRVYEEFVRSSLPLIEPIKSDYNANVCSMTMETMFSIGSFGRPEAMPEVLRNQEIRWDFDTPLKAAAEQQKVFAFAATVDTIIKGMQVDDTVALNVDFHKGTRDAVMGAGGADWLRPEKKVAELVAQKAEQAQAAAAAEAMAQGADIGSRMTTAMEGAASASQALQRAGAA